MKPERHAQIKKVFLAACERARDELEEFLVDTCGKDEDLRRQVEVLLAQHRPDESSGESHETAATLSRLHGEPTAGVPSNLTPSCQSDVFDPGHMIAERYRIVALLGEGGMGAVYRADDLQLGQSVALKFLLSEYARDPAWLRRFRQEVRLAREVTHPNVCRVHDIGEADGTAYISMEYVDGEDLRTLLKRIGRLPGDKAVEIAKQLCAGLAAAHIRGVLHRDLKPANIMLDGRGRVRITDFGLAGLVGQVPRHEMRAGTPRYMAPEQCAGKGVSEKSDLYALGLVLYEVFTGKAAFEAKNSQEYFRLHQDADPSEPSSIVRDIDPDAEAIILACLKKDPKSRPESALAVAAALPGGDILSAAIAAGETPSPEMVAGGGREQVQQTLIWGCLGGFIAISAMVIALSGSTHPIPAAGLQESPEVLASKARSIVKEALQTQHAGDFDYGFIRPAELERTMGWENRLSAKPLHLAIRDESSLLFWYRWSEEHLVPSTAANVLFAGAQVLINDPPAISPGMVTLALHPDGRLLFFAGNLTARSGTATRAPPKMWELFLKHAGVDAGALQPSDPVMLPSFYADSRLAWIGTSSSSEYDRIRVEAASHAGRPVLFAILDQKGASRQEALAYMDIRRLVRSSSRWLAMAVATVVGGVLAWRNYRTGRCDRRGALRVGILIFSLRMLVWLLVAHHAVDLVPALGLLSYAIMGAMAEAVVVWLFYLALEPYVRRFWPQAIVTWSRVLAGRFRDPLAGRDVLIGALIGAFWILVVRLDSLAPDAFGLTSRGQMTEPSVLSSLLSARQGMAACFDALRYGIYQGLLMLMLVVLLRVILRRPVLAAVAAVVVTSPMYVPMGSHALLSWGTLGLGGVVVAVWGLTRFGLLAIVTALVVSKLLGVFPITFNFKQWYADVSLLALLVVVGIVAWAFFWAQRAAVRRQPNR